LEVVTVTSDRITAVSSAVCEVIRAYRVRAKVTREEFAAACWENGASADFTATVIGHLETGRLSAGGRRREITLDELVFLAKAMDSTPLAVLGDSAVEFGAPPRIPEPAECARCAGRNDSLEAQVRMDVDELGELDPALMEPSLASTAYTLAAQIDGSGGEDGKALPQLTRELRATLAQIIEGRRGSDDPDDGDDDLGGLDQPE
jgi:hypothetical protein